MRPFHFRRTLLALHAIAFSASACSSSTDESFDPMESSLASVVAPERPLAANDILIELRHVPGVVDVFEKPSKFPNTRYFIGRFEQPVDHEKANGARFTQRFTLLYRSLERPMVLALEGYGISTEQYYLDEPVYLLQANRLEIEHRFFGESFPVPVDWSKLDVFQAATDQHRIVQAFRPLFGKKWLSTGGSKGGVTATLHRFFYPDDVFATVPYVAPINYGRSDPRYISFLEHVGDADCRSKLKTFQVELLRRRDEIEWRMTADASAAGGGYALLGIHRALDFTVTEAPFLLWQYLPSTFCASVPSATASTDDLYAFLQVAYRGSVYDGFGDAAMEYYAAFYYQSATELGAPGYDYSHMRDLLTPHFRDAPQDVTPFGVEKPFHPAAMLRLSSWVRARGERMLYLYGGQDPWSSHPFDVRAANDSYRYVVPNGTHRSVISDLPEAEKREAFATLSRWMDVPVMPLPATTTLDASGEPSSLPIASPAMSRRLHPLGK